MSTTPNIGLYKHDNVSTNTDQFDIDKSLNKNWDKIDTEIGELQATVTAFNFKGEVDTYTNLQKKTKTKGDVWYCTEKKLFYACNGSTWSPANVGMDLDYVNNIKNKFIRIMQEIETPPPACGENLSFMDSKKGKFKSFNIRGNSKQETSTQGQQLFDINKCKNEDVNGNSNSTRIRSALIKNNDNLTFGANNLGNIQFLVMYYDSINATSSTNSGWKKATYTVPKSTAPYARVLFMKDTGNTDINISDISNINFMINNGTTLLPYEQFTPTSPSPDYPSEVKSCGETINIFDGVFEWGNYDYATGAKVDNNTIMRSVNKMNVENLKQLTFVKPDSGFTIGLRLYSEDGTYVGRTTASSATAGSSTVSLESNVVNKPIKYMHIIIPNATNLNITLGINKDLSTKFIPYGQGKINITVDNNKDKTVTNYQLQTYTVPTQKPFRSIGDTRDTFIKEDGLWYEKHLINRIILNGTEDWEAQNGGNRFFLKIFYFTEQNKPIIVPISSYGPVLCSHFKAVRAGDTWAGVTGISYDNSATFDISCTNIATDVATFKNWLKAQYDAGTPVTVDYVLAKPELIPCTKEQNAILDEIYDNAETYDDVTHIYSTDEVAPNIECTYCKDINRLFNSIEI